MINEQSLKEILKYLVSMENADIYEKHYLLMIQRSVFMENKIKRM